jgi:NarL family two-component system response regulator LiaR
MHPIRVLIADDNASVRLGLRAVIHAERDMEVIDQACDGEEAVQKALALHPDVTLMDLAMPRKGGIEAIHEIKQAEPQARILVLTSFGDEALIFSAIQAGAIGYLLKDSFAQKLPEVIRCVYRGEPSVDPVIARKLALNFGWEQGAAMEETILTEQERQVVSLVAQGLSNQAIADQLNIVEHTVRFHVGNILAKLRIENRTEMALYAIRTGLVSMLRHQHDGPC